MKLLVAIDRSTQSIDTVHALAHFAPPEELTLVHALTLPNLDHPMIMPEVRDAVLQDIENKLRQEGKALLANSLKELPSDFGPTQQIHEIGSPAQVIVETAQSARSGLILLGARGLGRFKELALGSVSHRVLLHAPCSVLVIKRPLASLQKILLPVEGKEDAEIAFTFLASKPFRNPVDIHLIMVWPQPQVPWPITLGQSHLIEERAIQHAQEQLDVFTAKLTTMGYQATGHVGLGDPAYAIVEQQRATKADMIMLGTHGRGGMSRFLLGSISHTVLHQATCPILILR
ncbi:MAG: universal stress protein [Nitrospirales bacterium]